MNLIDIVLLTIIVGSTMTGLFWGLIRQAVSIFGLVGGIFLAGRFYEPIAAFLNGPDGHGLVSDPAWARVLAFGLVVIGFSLVLGIVASGLRLVLGLLFLGWVDHLLGAALGLVMALLMVSSLVVAATVFPIPNVSDAVRESVVAQWVGGFTPVVLAMLPPEFQTFRQMMGWGPL